MDVEKRIREEMKKFTITEKEIDNYLKQIGEKLKKNTIKDVYKKHKPITIEEYFKLKKFKFSIVNHKIR